MCRMVPTYAPKQLYSFGSSQRCLIVQPVITQRDAPPDSLGFVVGDTMVRKDVVLPRENVGELFNAIGEWLSEGAERMPAMALQQAGLVKDFVDASESLPLRWLSDSKTTEMPAERMAIVAEIHAERQAQDEQWGGAAHDDEHTVLSRGACWRGFIAVQSARADDEYKALSVADSFAEQRSRYVKMAALAFAGIESIDRVTGVK